MLSEIAGETGTPRLPRHPDITALSVVALLTSTERISPFIIPSSTMSGSTSDQIAGPSSPRISPPPSPFAISSFIQTDNDTDTQPAEPSTPAPPIRVEPPDAPSPKVAPKELPSQTPLSSVTPTTKGGPDISEFDPFATPTTPAPASVPPAGPSVGTGTSRGAGKEAARIRVVPAISERGTPATPSRAGETEGGTPSRRRDRESRQEVDKMDGEPAFNFSGFLKDLRLKSAEPVARYLKR